MKKVISFCLFAPERGSSTGLPREANLRWYCAYLPLTILGYKVLFPEFEVRLHSNLSLNEVLDDGTTQWAAENNVIKYVHVDRDDPLCLAMLWRIMPLFDPDVEYVFCRDVDAMPRIRDRKAVEVFIKSKCYVHALLDNVSHDGLMGGMCGFRVDKICETLHEVNWELFIARGGDWEIHGADQVFLARNLWGPFGGRRLMHDFIDRPPRIAGPIFNNVSGVVINDVPNALQNDLAEFPGCIGAPINHWGDCGVAEVLDVFRKRGYYIDKEAKKITGTSCSVLHDG